MSDSRNTEDDREELVERLKDVIGSEFDELSPSEVTDALGELATEMSDASEASSAPELSFDQVDRPKSEEANFLDAFSSTIAPFDLDQGGAVPLITISARSGGELSRICGQVLEVRALWLEMNDPPQLNQEVEVLFDLPEHGFELALPGRVVHRVGQRTAIDLSGLDDDDIASLREIADREDQGDPEAENSQRSGVAEEGARANIDVSESWDGSADSSLALSRTFETVSEAESYWYGPESRWLEPADIGAGATVRREVAPAELLLDVSEASASGMLEFAAGDRQFQIHVDEGHVVRFVGRPKNSREELGPMLRVADRVSEDDLGGASSHAIKQEQPLAKSLYDLEILSGDEIRQAVAGRLTYLLRKMCDLGEGTAQFTPRADLEAFQLPASEVRVHVPVERVIFRRRLDRHHQMDSGERDQLVDRDSTAYPTIVDGAGERIRRAFADEAHRRMVERLVDGEHKLADLVAESFLPPAETFAVVYTLRSMDLIEFVEEAEDAVIAPRFEDDVEIKHLSVHKASYFEVLNIHWSSYGELVDSAFEFQRRYFNPDREPEGLSGPSRKRLREIAERIDSAYKVLCDRESRHGYRQKIMPEYKLEHAIPLLIQRARLARRRGRDDLARDAYARIVEIQPDHSEAHEGLEQLGADTSVMEA
jgi:hypothetical protein